MEPEGGRVAETHSAQDDSSGKGMGPVTGGSPGSDTPSFHHQGCLENQIYSQDELEIEPPKEVPHPTKNVTTHEYNCTLEYIGTYEYM